MKLFLIVVDEVSDCDGSSSTPLSNVTIGSELNLAVDSSVRNEDGDDEKSNYKTNTTHPTSSNINTPPVQASVYPKIECGSSIMSATAKTITLTPVCYAAGHVVSGVTDKRKCEPRGILAVGEAEYLDCLNCDDEPEQENAPRLVNNSSSMLPLPSKASMH
ncbi:hypothetical protein GH714_025238 [Hevea brasiliensis]|uniref:Uncharacterized protein n=1 Tax=Hevea brasiliensis TaxID=3981 RepID=A0A6A6LF10_HEVBR|nr:hypothetical protein GH714_025238 [Hevea brasiliensis]